MTHLLWKYYWEDDLDKFCALLAPTSAYGAQSFARSPNRGTIGGAGHGSAGSPGAFGTSPRASSHTKSRHGRNAAALGKNEINSRDHAGLTVLLRAASSTSENALAFARALLDHPCINIYVQDTENGWNALHRSLYMGNVSIARCLLQKERRDLTAHAVHIHKADQLIKTKDHEGNSPFELYNLTIGERALKVIEKVDGNDGASDSDVQSDLHENGPPAGPANTLNLIDGDELFAFGSNKNLSLGLKDFDDRSRPEQVCIERPDHLLIGLEAKATLDVAKIPAFIRNKPLMIRDVALSKLHSAVITSDPVSNLYVCGIGRGGRLGLGNENTQLTYTPVQGGLIDKRVVQVALGQDHTMAIADDGALWTWGSNVQSQLGYTLPQPTRKDEEPISVTPRQVFGPLKREVILGIAASSIHSVAHTGTSLYCWGKNTGQLGLMDADSRSLDVQTIPRKVAPSVISGEIIAAVSAISMATTLLLKNHSVFVLTAYGFVRLNFSEISPLNSVGRFPMATRYDASRYKIQHIASGGDGIIAAVTTRGDLFTARLDHKMEANPTATSTTAPVKIRGAVTSPQCIWSAKKDGVRSLSVGEDVVFSTKSGAVWRRVKRITAKHAYTPGTADSKRKDFKFQRVPGITRIATVRASSFGAFGAIRKDSDIMKREIPVDPPNLVEDVASLSCLRGFRAAALASGKDEARYREFDVLEPRIGSAACEILKSTDIETDLLKHLDSWSHEQKPFDIYVCTDLFPAAKIPLFSWLLSARSEVLHRGLVQFRRSGEFELADGFAVTGHDNDKTLVTFHNLDILGLLNLVHFWHEDKVIPVWNLTRHAPGLAFRWRQVRTGLVKLAPMLNMAQLEHAVRLQVDPKKSMHQDFQRVAKESSFFEDGNVLLELDGMTVPVHSTFVCQRCPWFQGLFNGRSGGLWLASRREAQTDSALKVDLGDMDPEAFSYVLRYLYGDYGTELFDEAVTETVDSFLDLILDVLGMANYLMLDRLSQICQQVLGRAVTTRNLSQLLNEISPYSVSRFKDAGLEYICLQLENQLENHLLDDLDDSLLIELDQVVRGNQAAQFPFSKSGRAALLLHERYPELAEEISSERQRRCRDMAFKASIKARDDLSTPDRKRKVSREAKKVPCSPELKAKNSHVELMFAMDEDSAIVHSPSPRPQIRQNPTDLLDLDGTPALSEPGKGSQRKGPQNPTGSAKRGSLSTPAPRDTLSLSSSPRDIPSPHAAKAGNPWGTSTAAVPKLDLRNIIQSECGQSASSAGPTAQKAKEGALKSVPGRVSQKERKKQQQQQQQQQESQAAQTTAQTAQTAQVAARGQQPLVAWKKPPAESQPSTEAVHPAARPTPQRSLGVVTREGGASQPPSRPLVPHSKSYLPLAPRTEHIAGLSMTDIIGQQRREQEVVKEAVAKRSLLEIQFEQWWEAESRRTQEEEARRLSKEQGKEDREKGGGKRGRRTKTTRTSETGGSTGALVKSPEERGAQPLSGSPAVQPGARSRASERARGKGKGVAGGISHEARHPDPGNPLSGPEPV